jgi:hypothetical protein
MARLPELYEEIKDVLEQHQPELQASLLSNRIEIVGTFICASEEGPFDRFDVKIQLSELFPDQEPRLEEVGGRIPHTLKRHVFSNGSCCLGLWEAWLAKTPEADFESYLLGPVTSYFVSQFFFEQTEEWPFGEQGHSAAEIAATYSEALAIPPSTDEQAYLRLLTQPLLTGNPQCPCGSGNRLRQCHWKEIRERRRNLPAYVRKGMAKRLARGVKD